MFIAYIQKKGRNKVKVTMDDGESFIISEKDWKVFGGEAGEEMEDVLIEKLYREYLLPKAKYQALNLLKVRDRSRKELSIRLKTYGYPSSIISETLKYVDQYHYLDDERYARNYVNYKGGKKSRRELEYELSSKGIDLHAAAEADQELILPDDRETILGILVKRWGENPLPERKEKMRMMSYLGRRGFHAEDILAVYRDLGI